MLELLWLFLLISFNAFFAASEIALISLNLLFAVKKNKKLCKPLQ